VIKLDIVNAIVAKTNITRTKAEQAVETVFEAMKNALGRGERIELRRFGVFNVKPRKTGILPVEPFVSSPEKNCSPCLRPARHPRLPNTRPRRCAAFSANFSATFVSIPLTSRIETTICAPASNPDEYRQWSSPPAPGSSGCPIPGCD
jgi:hypothetical protein